MFPQRNSFARYTIITVRSPPSGMVLHRDLKMATRFSLYELNRQCSKCLGRFAMSFAKTGENIG